MLLVAILSPVIYVPPTPESVTAHRMTYDCSVVDEDFNHRRLRFSTIGGRGYVAADGSVQATPLRYEFVEDGTGILADTDHGPIGGSERGMRFDGDQFTAEIREVTPFLKGGVGIGWKASLVVTIDRGPHVERLAGFCDVSAEEQPPLSASEISELPTK